MQNQHSISVASEIRRKLPPKIASEITAINITLVGEQTEDDKGGTKIIKKGEIQVRGTASSVHMQSKIIELIKENSGGRQVKNHTTVKQVDSALRRRSGLWG